MARYKYETEINDHGARVHAILDDGIEIATAIDKEAALLIVSALNGHAEAVAACEAAEHRMTTDGYEPSHAGCGFLTALRAALAKAKAGSEVGR